MSVYQLKNLGVGVVVGVVVVFNEGDKVSGEGG